MSSTSVWVSWLTPHLQYINGKFVRYEVGFRTVDDTEGTAHVDFQLVYVSPLEESNVNVTELQKYVLHTTTELNVVVEGFILGIRATNLPFESSTTIQQEISI